MIEERDELLARIATLYYHNDLSQQEIAQRIGLSRSNISRLLKEARDRGIVEIHIHHPIKRDLALEQQICEHFGLQAARVVNTVAGDFQATLWKVAHTAGELLNEYLRNAKIFAISWGTTVHAIVEAFNPRHRYDVEVVQLMGGVLSSDPAIDGPTLVQRLAHSLTGRYRYLHAPLIVDRAEVAQALISQRNIVESLEVAERADVALVGIGALDATVSSLLRAGYLSEAEFATIISLGGVGDICARHFDAQGRPVAPEIDARIIAISLERLAAIPTVIGAACGIVKAKAILGALRGGYLDILVTDSATAAAVLELAGC
ncbi:sugar-binding transcriptional regulator [Chloroflexus sp.]|uniref:sugar-binding transcriptional regulator n=2 Tax=Chloroflexus sp. TaxID=1904827 RepID=UPI00298F1A75|nr:sugar-binding transcriptional regulator [Chloroflexus sp.]MDW8403490.1 sugar-binding transcriptional regulator [Chloroflexus sp.]